MIRNAALAVTALTILSAASLVRAEENRGCEVSVGSVLASNASQDFDTRLTSLQRQFDALPYKSYRLLKRESRSVDWGGPAAFDLPGGRYLLVVPKEFKDGRVSIKILLIDGSRHLVDSAISLRDRGTILVGGPKHEGGVLIISIAARTTKIGVGRAG
jgi:hypothetical protein